MILCEPDWEMFYQTQSMNVTYPTPHTQQKELNIAKLSWWTELIKIPDVATETVWWNLSLCLEHKQQANTELNILENSKMTKDWAKL